MCYRCMARTYYWLAFWHMCCRFISMLYRWTISTVKWYNFKVCYHLLLKFSTNNQVFLKDALYLFIQPSDFVCQPWSTDSRSSECNPFFEDAIGAMDGTHFISSGSAEEQRAIAIAKGLSLKTVLLPVILITISHTFPLVGTQFLLELVYILELWHNCGVMT